MSKFARHEIVMNGINTEGNIQRTLVIDANKTLRHVFKLNKHYHVAMERTSQYAFAGDYSIETNIQLDENGEALGYSVDVFLLTGPCSTAQGRPQLFRVSVPNKVKEEILATLKQSGMKDFRQFLLLDENLQLDHDLDLVKTNAVLPSFLTWNGQVGVTEEKQAAYVIDLLGGAPVNYIETLAESAMYSRRQYIMPFDTLAMPKALNFEQCNIGSVAGIVMSPNHQVDWVIFHRTGGVSLIRNKDEADDIELADVSNALKIYIDPFITETGERYGLVVEVYESMIQGRIKVSSEQPEEDPVVA